MVAAVSREASSLRVRDLRKSFAPSDGIGARRFTRDDVSLSIDAGAIAVVTISCSYAGQSWNCYTLPAARAATTAAKSVAPINSWSAPATTR